MLPRFLYLAPTFLTLIFLPTYALSTSITLDVKGVKWDFIRSDHALSIQQDASGASELTDWFESLNHPGWSLPTTVDGTWGYSAKDNPTKFNVKDKDSSFLGFLFYEIFNNDVALDTSGNVTSIALSQEYVQKYQTFFDLPGVTGDSIWMVLEDGSHLTHLPPSQKSLLSLDLPYSWAFSFENGAHFLQFPNCSAYGLAIRMHPTPEPSSGLLVFSGLLFFSHYQRRQRN